MQKYNSLVADLQPYQKYLPLLQKYFTLDANEIKLRDEMIKMLSCKTDAQVAAAMTYSKNALRVGGYTWQFNKAALEKFFSELVEAAKAQQKWTKKEWMEVAFDAAKQLDQQNDKLRMERNKVERAVEVAGYAAEHGADKARITARDTKARLREFSAATRKLNSNVRRISNLDIERLQQILDGERTDSR